MNAVKGLLRPRSIPREDWILIAVVSAASFIMVGICAVIVTQLIDPLMREFRWTNAAVSGLATVYGLASMLSGPAVGVMIDRLGSRRIMALGIGITAIGFLGLSRCHSLHQIYAAFVVIGIGYGGAFFLASTTMIARRLNDDKNFGMGAIMCAGSIGAALFSILIGKAIIAYGWREAAVASAAVMALTLVPILALIPAKPDSEPAMSGSGHGADWRSLPPLRLFLSPSFSVIVVASALASFGMSAVYFHAVPIFLNAGFSAGMASAILGASWVLSALGSLVTGICANRVGASAMLALSLLLGAIGTIFLASLTGGLIGYLSVAIFLILWGATANAINQFLPILLADRFGATHLGTLTGVQGALMGLVGSFAPLATGALFDLYASYRVSIVVSTIATLLALALVIAFRRQATPGRYFAEPSDA